MSFVNSDLPSNGIHRALIIATEHDDLADAGGVQRADRFHGVLTNRVTRYFNLPPEKVFEVGTQIPV